MMSWINSRGYREVRLPDGRKIKEHRLIMEKHIGRRLSPEEIVHHRNGNRLDNRKENLQIMTRSQHGKEHGTEHLAPYRPRGTAALIKRNLGRPAWNSGTKKYISLTCNRCGLTFQRALACHRMKRRSWVSYCSRKCSNTGKKARS
jgi:hypothetical protein